MDQSSDQPAATTEQVLLHEFRLIWGDAAGPEDEKQYRKAVFERDQAALCLSGGGMRSAAFAIGLFQALSRKGLLTRFHYLSATGAGACAAGWLHRWIAETAGGPPAVMAQLASPGGSQIEALLPQSGRRLIPQRGIYFDPWGKAAVHFRNQLVNWLSLAPLLMGLALVPTWLLQFVGGIAEKAGDPLLRDLSLAFVTMVLAVCAFFAFRYHPAYRSASAAPPTGDVLSSRLLLPLVNWLAFGVFVLCIGPPLEGSGLRSHWLLALSPPLAIVAAIGASLVIAEQTCRAKLLADLPVWFVASLAVGVAIGGAWEAVLHYRPDPFAFLFEAVGWVGSFTGAFNLKGGLPAAALAPQEALAVLVFVGPFILLIALLTGITCFLALRRRRQAFPDADNAWMTLLSGYLVKAMGVWAVVGGAVLLIASGAKRYVDLDIALLTTVGAVALFLVFFASKESDSLGGIGSFVIKLVPLKLVSTLATALFLLVLLLLASAAAETFAEGVRGVMRHYLGEEPLPETPTQTAMLILMILGIIPIFIPANRFSMHAVRRNQLTSGFLATARGSRNPDRFTGYDSDDDLPLFRLRPKPGEGPATLFPIFNAAFRARGGCAAPFTFTPAHIGSAALEPPREPAAGAFVRTDPEVASNPNTRRSAAGISLADAMAASGAGDDGRRLDDARGRAIVAALLGLRRGLSLSNPAYLAEGGWDWHWQGRRLPLIDLAQELLGGPSEVGGQIELQQGGRFDNLGLHEALRRRCRYVLVSDATFDPDRSLADLAAAIRNARIGLTVSIHFDGLNAVAGPAPRTEIPTCAIGRIIYPEGSEGMLLYIKAELPPEAAPIEVASYARCSKDFPHESTADEKVTDSQFESYRRLGEYLGERLPPIQEPNLALLFAAVLAQQGGEVAAESEVRSDGSAQP